MARQTKTRKHQNRNTMRSVTILLGCSAGGALILTAGLLLYRTLPEQGFLSFDLLLGMSAATGAMTVTAAILFHACRSCRRTLQHLECRLADLAQNDSENLLESIAPFPAGAGQDDAGAGWNRLVDAIDRMLQTDRLRQIQTTQSQFLCSYDAQRLLGVLDALPDGVLLADPRGNVILANRSCEGILGKHLSEFMHGSILDLLPDSRARQELAQIFEVPFRQANVSMELALPPKAKTGEEDCRHLKIIARRLQDTHDQSDILVFLRDITQQKVSDASREDFIAHVSHELRSPLTNIRAYAETLLSDMVLDAQTQKEAFNVINEETSRLVNLVNEVLDLSRMETGSLPLNKGEVVTGRLVEQIVNDLKASAVAQKITIQTNYHPKLPNLFADRDKLAVVLHNILSNAIKYTPEGGTIVVETNISEGFLYIKVSDTGYGIAPEDIDRIFEKFYRVERQETANIPGTGLGLSTAKSIVQMHGGTIHVASELNSGTEMTIQLPITAVGPVLGPAADKP